MGAPPGLIGRMVLNLASDLVVGSVPLVGDLFDVAFKSKSMNAALLRDHLEREARQRRVTARGHGVGAVGKAKLEECH